MAEQNEILASGAEHGASAPAPAPGIGEGALPRVGEVVIRWQQKSEEVAPLLEMRAYLDELRDAGVAVGALSFASGADGQLSGHFSLTYDPASPHLLELESTLQGLGQLGHGLQVVESHEQTIRRWERLGPEQQARVVQAANQVMEAFGYKQWDALSARLSAVPKYALTAPEQEQQAAAGQRVLQLARQQGKATVQVIRDAKSIFDIDTSGNPASAFLKNFYAHLNGGPKTRQSLEVDLEQTRRELQARLSRPGAAPMPAREPEQNVQQQPEMKPRSEARTPGADESAKVKAAYRFEAGDVPRSLLYSLGVKTEDLAASGQLDKLLRGEKTDLLPLEVAGRTGREPVRFPGRMVLQREADGSATLHLELPRQQLVIPQEIGGQVLTPEQREKLLQEGNAGLVRGLRDEQGRKYNGYVAVDRTINQVVVLPENKVTLQDTVAGVPLSPAQCRDLREGKVVSLQNMASSNGGPRFDCTVQVNAARACLDVKPAAPGRRPRQTPRRQQEVKPTRRKSPGV